MGPQLVPFGSYVQLENKALAAGKCSLAVLISQCMTNTWGNAEGKGGNYKVRHRYHEPWAKPHLFITLISVLNSLPSFAESMRIRNGSNTVSKRSLEI